MDEIATSEKVGGISFYLFFVLVKLFAFMYSMMRESCLISELSALSK